MTKSRKNLFLVALTVVLALSMAIFAGVVKPARAEGEVPTSFDAQTFYMDGADVRLADPVGLGFKTSINKAVVDALGDNVIATGTIIMPSYYVERYALTLEGAAQVLAELNKNCVVENDGYFNRSSATDVYQFRGSIIVNAANYTLDFSACSYVTYIDAEGETQTFYAQNPVTANAKAIALPWAKKAAFMEEYANTAVETQINAYVSAWDFDAKLFDPENDWRRLSYGSTKYNYDSVVDAGTLGFGGNSYTGKAVRLDGVSASQVALSLDDGKYHDLITNSDYYSVTLNIAFGHKNLDDRVAAGKFTGMQLLDTSSPFFNSSSSFALKSIELGSTGHNNYRKWIKRTIPVSALIEYFGDDDKLSELNIICPDMAKGYDTNGDPTTNYEIYIGEITIEKVNPNKLMVVAENEYTASYLGIGVSPSYTLATAEELNKISGAYTGGAYKSSYVKDNSDVVTMNIDFGRNRLINNADYTDTTGYKYVSFNFAYLPDEGVTKSPKFSSGLLINLKEVSTQYKEFAVKKWVNYCVALDNVYNLSDTDFGFNISLLSGIPNGASRKGYFLIGDIELLKEPATGATVVERDAEDIQGRYNTYIYNRVTGTTVEPVIKNGNGETLGVATPEELDSMTGYGDSIGVVKKAQVFKTTKNAEKKIWLDFAIQKNNITYTRYKEVAIYYANSDKFALPYKYLVTYVAVTGKNENTISFNSGTLFVANGSTTLKFGNDGHALNTWYKVVIPIADYLNGDYSPSSTGGELLLGAYSVSAGEVSDYTVWFGSFDFVNEEPEGYNGSWITAMPAANA